MGTITKALELLNEFSPSRAEISLVEMARLTKRDKATIHRHLTELQANGILEQNPTTRAYRLGAALLRLAALREHCFPTSRLLRPLVTDLAEEVGELVHASLLQAESLSPLVHSDPQVHGTQVHFDPSEVLPLHATASGLAVMAFLPEDRRERILSRPLAIFTNRTQTDPDHLRRLLAEISQAGICIVDGSFDPEVASIGAPLFGDGDQVVGAVAIAAPRGRARTDRLASLAQKLTTYAQAACQTLGGQYPSFPARSGRVPQISAAQSGVGD
ncbi:MAG: IclR family transcriptional regulator [Pseudomonadota bacterium]